MTDPIFNAITAHQHAALAVDAAHAHASGAEKLIAWRAAELG